MKYKLALSVYPTIQISSFAAASYYLDKQLVLAAGLVLLASLFMSYSLHITYHHHVHHKPKNNIALRFLDFLYTACLGMPFQTYQVQHFMHHRFDNKIGDFTCTYKEQDGELKPKHWFPYSFLWFIGVAKAKNFKIESTKKGFFNEKIQRKMRQELFLNLVIALITLTISWELFLLYYTMIYLGWSFIALHNYGQHLPVSSGYRIGFSYYARWYNFLFFNNGLHAEHHDKPAIRYEDLKENRSLGGINNLPHILQPLNYTKEIQS